MAEETAHSAPARSKDEVALELMKFVVVTTGYGKAGAGAGFSGKSTRSPEEHTDMLLHLFERCRATVGKTLS